MHGSAVCVITTHVAKRIDSDYLAYKAGMLLRLIHRLPTVSPYLSSQCSILTFFDLKRFKPISFPKTDKPREITLTPIIESKITEWKVKGMEFCLLTYL